MPKKPIPALPKEALTFFGTPTLANLQQRNVLSKTIARIIAADKAIAAFHHKLVHNGICSRFELALTIAACKKAYANFAKDVHIAALKRPPKGPSDTFKCLCQATYDDPKKASKYFKRLEPMWIERRQPKDVLNFLEKYGLSKLAPEDASDANVKVKLPKLPPRATEHTVPKKTQVESKRNKPPSPPPQLDSDDPPGGCFEGWPGLIVTGEMYDVRVKIVKYDNDVTYFEVIDVSRSTIQ